MTIPAKSVMTTDIVTVSPETTVAETARRMLIHHVTALPVVDPDNRPLGLVSEGDVMRHFGAQFQSKRAQWLRMLAEGETLAPEFLAEIRLNQQHVREIMHAAIISADEEASLAELADLMLKHGIKRVPILRDGVLVGMSAAPMWFGPWSKTWTICLSRRTSAGSWSAGPHNPPAQRPVGDRQQRHGDDLRCARQGDRPREHQRQYAYRGTGKTAYRA